VDKPADDASQVNVERKESAKKCSGISLRPLASEDVAALPQPKHSVTDREKVVLAVGPPSEKLPAFERVRERKIMCADDSLHDRLLA
jgi:hypothetical protein